MAGAGVQRMGAGLNGVNAGAASATTALVPMAADEVSAAITALFAEYGQTYKTLIAKAVAFHEQFANTLAASALSYATSEVANATATQEAVDVVNAASQALLGHPLLGSGGSAGQVGAAVQSRAAVMSTPAATGSGTTLIMGPSSVPIPPVSFVNDVNSLYIQPRFPGFTPQPLFTPEEIYPTSNLNLHASTFDQSVSEGLTILNNALLSNAGNNVTVFGYSQSAVISSLEMRQLAALSPALRPATDQLAFVLVGDPMNPNGGLFERFNGLSLSYVGMTFPGATPDNVYPTTIYSLEYDGYPDFPQYPIDLPADLNAFLGVAYLHGTYAALTPSQVTPVTDGGQAIRLPTQGPTQTAYYIIPTQNLPLLDPLRAIPVVGNPLADLIQPDMKVIVNLGYGNPAYGYSTGPANVPTPFGLFPNVNPVTVLQDLVTGTQQGITQTITDMASPSSSGLSLTSLSNAITQLPGDLTNALSNISVHNLSTAISPSSLIGDLQAATASVTTAFSTVTGAAVSLISPTAEVGLSLAVTMPTYDTSLFLDELQVAIDGNPVGLVNAIGYPIAANTALVPFATLVETEMLLDVFGVSPTVES